MSDVFRSIVVPRPTQGALRLGPWLGHGLLALALRFGKRCSADRRHDALGALGPLLLVLTAVTWFSLIITGFALAMHATGRGFAPPLGSTDAVFTSASSFLTLGSIGHEARSVQARTIVIGAGLCGFAIVPLVVTFLLNVQGALTQREQLVLRIGERDRRPPSGLGILTQYGRLGPGKWEAFERFLDEWDRWCAQVLITHRAFPVLAYFRSTDQECDWLAALGAVLDAAALVAVLGHGPAAERAVLCHRTGSRLARDLSVTFRCTMGEGVTLTKARFDDVCHALRHSGYAGLDDQSALFDAFAKLRAGHEPTIGTLCNHFGVRRKAF